MTNGCYPVQYIGSGGFQIWKTKSGIMKGGLQFMKLCKPDFDDH